MYAILFTVLSWAIAADPPAALDVLEGNIVAVDQGRLTIATLDKKIHSFIVPADAQITLNGKPAELADLKPNQAATVMSERQGKNHVAKSIMAFIQK